MKQIALLLILLGTILISPAFTTAHVEVGGDCDNPTITRTITAAPAGNDADISFDKSEIHVPVSTCLKMVFYNNAPSQPHSFWIYNTSDFGGIHVHLHNNTDGPFNNGTEITNIMTPSNDVVLPYTCEVGAHAQAGMKGDFIVGNPNTGSSSTEDSSLPLSILPVIGSLLMSVVAIPIIGKRN